MSTITKKELIDRIAESAGSRRVLVKKVAQQFLDQIGNEVGGGNRPEFRDFESKHCSEKIRIRNLTCRFSSEKGMASTSAISNTARIYSTASASSG